MPDVGGPSAQPISHEPDLTASVLAGLQRDRLLPRASLAPVDMVNARTLLAVTLTRRPASKGRFRLLGNAYSVASAPAEGCTTFSPETVSQPLQIWLGAMPGEASASAYVSAVPAAAGRTNHLAAVIVPPGGPAATEPAQLVMPPKGSAYVDYNDPAAKLVLMWTAGTPLKLCGLEAAHRP